MLELFKMKHKASSAFNRKLPAKHFIIAILIILLLGLVFLGGIYFIVNIEYQKPQTTFSNGPVTTKPRSLLLDLDQPEDNSLVFSDSIVVSGKTASIAEVLIYTDTNDLVVKSKPDGSFSTELDSDEGENNITVAIFDQTGQSKSLKRSVYYSKEKI